MKKTNRFLAVFLSACLFGGCSYPSVNKTIVLPSQQNAGTSNAEDSSADWEVKKIYQYQYTTANMSSAYNSDLTTIGWSSEEDYILYTINTRRGQPQTVINKVDVRYGFYEEIANLGNVDYNTMKISPDGKYLLYDTVDVENQKVTLYLYTIADQTTSTVAELPAPMPDQLMLNFSWSDDSSIFYYWITTTGNSYALEGFLKTEGWEHFYNLCAPFFDAPDGNMLYQVKSCIPSTLEQKVALNLELELEKSLGFTPGFAIEKKVILSSDGKKLLVSGGYSEIPFVTLADCTTDHVQTIDVPSLYDYTDSNVIFTQIVNDHIYGRNFYDAEGLLMFTDFSKDPKYTTVVLRNASAYQDAYSYQSLVTADESHLITLELSSSKETQIYIYRFRDNLSGQLTDKTLLYQSTDPIHDIRITPDNRFIILRTVLQEGDSYSASINRGEGGEYGDVDVAGKDYNYSIEDSYKITILEL